MAECADLTNTPGYEDTIPCGVMRNRTPPALVDATKAAAVQSSRGGLK